MSRKPETRENTMEIKEEDNQVPDIAVKSEDIKQRTVSQLQMPQRDIDSQGSSFRNAAPVVLDVVSLKTGHNEPLETMHSNKELNLHGKGGAKANGTSRYGASLDADDRSVLKTAISKVVAPAAAIEGETLEQLQERIMNEMLQQL